MQKPVYLLGGGRPRTRNTTDALVRTILQDFAVESPSIAYTGTANHDDTGFFERIAAEFKKGGAGSVTHAVIDRPGADVKKAAGILAAADVVFISGGDVDHGMEVLQENDMTGFLTDLFRNGKPFFGISAGAIMMAQRWVRWTDPDDAASAELFPCLGFAPVICDCHDEESGWEELRAALALEQTIKEGYGLVSGSGIRVAPDGAVGAIGEPVHRYIRQGGDIIRSDDIRPRY